ncbi:MAG: tRNA lysidine(34) synthetase TilS [Parasphingorhabdus sp.]|nr:tRNA lysidine(34) synthetase TilS [Parasphingorhabdus sp.]
MPARDPDPVAKFAKSLNAIAPSLMTGNDRLGIAVSGGPDSLALLLLAQDLLPGRVDAATVDHGLRPESRAEAGQVAEICASRGIPHKILTPAEPITGSLQSAARKTRYDLLYRWAEERQLSYIATAHHADDQLETLVMRLLRGSGIDGLAGIRARRGTLIRPLLGFTKAELIGYLAEQGISPVADPSNECRDFDRVRVRQGLEKIEGFDMARVSVSVRALEEARAALDWIVSREANHCITVNADSITLQKTDYPSEIQRRLLSACLLQIDPKQPLRGPQISDALKRLGRGERLTLGNILCEGGEVWKFSVAPARRKID